MLTLTMLGLVVENERIEGAKRGSVVRRREERANMLNSYITATGNQSNTYAEANARRCRAKVSVRARALIESDPPNASTVSEAMAEAMDLALLLFPRAAAKVCHGMARHGKAWHGLCGEASEGAS